MFRKTFLVCISNWIGVYIRHRRDAAKQQQHAIMAQRLFALFFTTDTAMLKSCVIVFGK